MRPLFLTICCICLARFAFTQQSDSLGTRADLDPVEPYALAHHVGHTKFNQGILTSPLQLINGRITGLGMTTYGADPNGDFILRIRGLSTLQRNTDPLIVVDGFIVDDLQMIDPADVSEVTLLKDAASTSYYGVRGANGVLIINSKKTSSAPSIRYTSTIGTESALKKVRPVSASEYLEYPNATDLGDSQNYLDLITRKAFSFINNLSISESAGKLRYKATVNHRSVEGTLWGSGFDQFNSRVSLQRAALNNRLLLAVELGATLRESDFGFKQAIKYAWNTFPTMPVYDMNAPQNGYFYQTNQYAQYNPVAIVKQNVSTGKNTILFSGLNGSYEFDKTLKGLGLRLGYRVLQEQEISGTYFSKNSYYIGKSRNGLATRNAGSKSSEQFESSLYFKKNNQTFDLLINSGYQFQEYTMQNQFLSGGDFTVDANGYNNISESLDFKNGKGEIADEASGYKVVTFNNSAYLGLNSNKYFVKVSANYSGSTRFGSDNKWGLFPAVVAGAQWQQEILFFSFLKLRVGWGMSGNIPQYSNLSSDLITSGSGYYYYNGSYYSEYTFARNANQALKGEEKTEINIGVDFAFLNKRVRGSIDWFRNKVTDLITPVTVASPPNPSPNQIVNLGEIQNKGVEITLETSMAQTELLNWDLQLNISAVTSTVNSLGNGEYHLGNNGQMRMGTFADEAAGCGCTAFIKVEEGKKIGALSGPVYTGLEQDGAPRFQDIDGDGVFCSCPADYRIIGNAMPKFIVGLGNSITYKTLNISFLMRGAVGHDKLNSYRMFHEPTEAVTWGNMIKTKNFDPRLTRSSYSSLYVEKASFLKLDNIALTYRLPFASMISVNAVAQNLFTITRYQGMDPEVAYGEPSIITDYGYIDQSPLIAGIERKNNYLPSRIFSLGVTFTF